MKEKTLTENIQRDFSEYLLSYNNYNSVCENFDYRGWEFDVAALNTTGKLHEYEVKISRSDFLRDKKKGKWAYFENKTTFNLPNYFSYVCPEGLIKPEEIPAYAGLYYYENENIICLKSPKKIHNEKPDTIYVLEKMLRLTIERKYLGASRMTLRDRKIKSDKEKREQEKINPYLLCG